MTGTIVIDDALHFCMPITWEGILDQFREQIARAKTGDTRALRIVRIMCERCCEGAAQPGGMPAECLIRVAELILEMGDEYP